MAEAPASPEEYMQNLYKALCLADQKERELSLISIINISKQLPDNIIVKLFDSDLIKILGQR